MSETSLRHLSPQTRPLADKPVEARIRAIRQRRWIAHEPARLLLLAMQEIFDQPQSDRMTGLLLTAASGMGKTMLLKTFNARHRSHPPAEPGEAQYLPVLYVLMPDRLSGTSFYHEILRALGAPLPSDRRISRDQFRETVLRVLQAVRTRVLIVDEINSALEGSANEQRAFLQLLRYLSNQLSLAILCAGTPEAEHVLYAEPQIRSRLHHLELPLWQADEDLQLFVNLLVQSYPLRAPSPVQNAQLLRLLVERSGGITKTIGDALERAAIIAVQSGTEKIDLTLLRQDAVWSPFAATDRLPARLLKRRAGCEP